MNILLIGNGISRLLFQDFIDKWQGEKWVCNYAYKDVKGYTRWSGHIVRKIYIVYLYIKSIIFLFRQFLAQTF